MTKKPNILFITSDQHRADSLGCAGHPCVQTPHLDQLAYEGIRFTNAYSDCPVCIPARTTMITGIQSHIYGEPNYAEDYRIERTKKDFLGSLITSANYHSCLVGKTHWHTPNTFRAGFEHVNWLTNLRKKELIETGRSFNPTGIGFNELSATQSKLPPHLHTTDWIVDQCIDFLETREQEQPFFLWASFPDPHPPLVIHEPYFSMYDNDAIPEAMISEWSQNEEQCPLSHYRSQQALKTQLMTPAQFKKMRSVYYGMITNIDHQLGRLFGKIMNDGEWDNTLIVYTSDHGEFLGDHGNGKKNSFCEASAKVPFIVRPPKNMQIEPGQESDALIELADILPTFCESACVEPPDDVTGKSLWPIINGKQENIREELHGQINNSHMYHDGTFKYLYYVEDGKELLFNVKDDPNDMTPMQRSKKHEMKARLKKHLVAEGSEHITADGELLNMHQNKPDKKYALAQDGAALAPTATLHNNLQNTLHIH